MLRETLKKKPKQGKFLFYIIIAVFIGGALFFVQGDGASNFQEHDVSSDINSLLDGIQAIFYGDINGFFEGIVGGMSIVALFLVLFTITHFLFTTVLKNMFGKKSIATVMALVVSAYGFFDHRIYNYLLSLNAFAIGLLVFFAIIIMIWGFSSKNVERLDKDFRHNRDQWKHNQEMRRAMSGDKKSIREYNRRINNLDSRDKEKLYADLAERKKKGWS